jgi:chorismate synthase
VAKVFLAAGGIQIRAWTSSIAGIDIPGPFLPGGGQDPAFDLDETENNPFRIPRRDYAERVAEKIGALKKEGDSAGGAVSCRVEGLPAGLGEPVFGKLDARLAAAMLSLGACKGIEFGAGFAASGMKGSENNDAPLPGGAYKTNKAGGVLGGISTGMPLEFRTVFKPVPSISREQETIDRRGEVRKIVIQGRHDVCIVPRAAPVVEAMSALVLADLLLLQRCAGM